MGNTPQHNIQRSFVHKQPEKRPTSNEFKRSGWREEAEGVEVILKICLPISSSSIDRLEPKAVERGY
jgi:hypothetical protein